MGPRRREADSFTLLANHLLVSMFSHFTMMDLVEQCGQICISQDGLDYAAVKKQPYNLSGSKQPRFIFSILLVH